MAIWVSCVASQKIIKHFRRNCDVYIIGHNKVLTNVLHLVSLIHSDPGSPETLVIIHTLVDDSIRIESFYTDTFLIFDNGEFRGGKGGNDIFKLEHGPRHGEVVLRVAKPDSESDQEADKKCYLGFESSNSEPKCFYSISSSTIFWIYP